MQDPTMHLQFIMLIIQATTILMLGNMVSMWLIRPKDMWPQLMPKWYFPPKWQKLPKMVETVEEVDHSDHDYSYDEIVDDILDDEDVYDVDDLGGRNSEWTDKGGRTSKIN